MAETKFTPGPWTAMENGWIEGEDGDPIAMINDGGLSGSCFPEDIPNAHLIASSPKMYEAMQEFIDRCDRGEVRSVRTYNNFKRILSEARGEDT